MKAIKTVALAPMLAAGLLFVGIQAASADPSEGLIAHWPFDVEDPVGETPEIVNGNDGVLNTS